MKTATVTQIKKELQHLPQAELIELCLQLSKFKKENKELLSYLLFENSDEDAFIEGVKEEMLVHFDAINTKTYFYIKKSVRKILKGIKKYIRYSKKTETEIELLLFFCTELKNIDKPISRNTTLQNTFDRQILLIKKAIAKLHEDLQFDYTYELNELTGE